jgi:uncharacterized protein YggE
MDRIKIMHALAILCITAVVIVGFVMLGKNDPFQNQFNVSGQGRVFAKPDIANLTVGVKTEVKATAAEAVKENTKKMNEIIKALKDLDIDEKDIKTVNYSLNPSYDWSTSRQRLLGYEVSQNVTIKIRDLDKIGETIAKTTEKGANQIGNIEFTIDDENELKAQARDLAIEKAKAKAEDIVKKTGMKLGKIINVYENQYYAPQTNYYAKDLAYGLGGGSEALPAPAIQVGQNEVMVEVNVVYEVK